MRHLICVQKCNLITDGSVKTLTLIEQRRICMCWSSNSRKNMSCTDNQMSCSRNRNNRGHNMHSRMKLHPYKLKIHPNKWHGVDMVSSVVDHKQGIHHHACHWVHACNPTHSTHSPRQRQEASPTGVEHVLWQVDEHDHQHTLENHQGHYALVCRRFSRTQEYHAHVIRWVGWRS